MSEWQQTEAAPLRTRVLVYGTTAGEPGIAPETGVFVAIRWPEGWSIVGGRGITPTHWMHLPAPPAYVFYAPAGPPKSLPAGHSAHAALQTKSKPANQTTQPVENTENVDE